MRNTGLNSRTELKSSSTLSSSSSLGGGGRIAPRSKKMQKIYEESRIPFVQDFLERNPWCSFVLWVHGTTIEESPPLGSTGHGVTHCMKRAVDVHEIVARSHGGNIVPVEGQNEDDQFKAMCRDHHTYVTTHPAFAKLKGYSR